MYRINFPVLFLVVKLRIRPNFLELSGYRNIDIWLTRLEKLSYIGLRTQKLSNCLSDLKKTIDFPIPMNNKETVTFDIFPEEANKMARVHTWSPPRDNPLCTPLRGSACCRYAQKPRIMIYHFSGGGGARSFSFQCPCSSDHSLGRVHMELFGPRPDAHMLPSSLVQVLSL